MKKPLKYRDLRKRLKQYGVVEDKKRGKGSERMFLGFVDGRPVTYPTKCHNEGDEKPTPVIEAIRRHFHLTEEYGITDDEFYAGWGGCPTLTAGLRTFKVRCTVTRCKWQKKK